MSKLYYRKLLYLSPFLKIAIFIWLIFYPVSLLSSNDNKKLNIILITFDALRADHLGCYGYPIKITPNMDKLAKEGTLFTQTYAQASWTVPSITSILTSLYPSVHKNFSWYEDIGFPSLTTILYENGYRTAFFTDHTGMKNRSYLFKDFNINTVCSNNSELKKSIFNFLTENRNREFFLYIHHLDPHGPYTPPDSYINSMKANYTDAQNIYLNTAEQVAYFHYPNETMAGLLSFYKDQITEDNVRALKKIISQEYAVNFNGLFRKILATNQLNVEELAVYAIDERDLFHIFSLFRGDDRRGLLEKIKNDIAFYLKIDRKILEEAVSQYDTISLQNIDSLKKDIVKTAILFYDGEVAGADSFLGELLQKLKELSLKDNLLIIISADHGDEFLKHGESQHGNDTLYDEVLHIPLIISCPKLVTKGKIIANQVQSIDIMPTILQILGIASPSIMQGRSLIPLVISNNKDFEERPIFSHIGTMVSMRYDGWKLIYNFTNEKAELYNLRNDPYEQLNLIEDSPKVLEELKSRLINFLNSSEEIARLIPVYHKKIVYDEETKEKLRSLGYLQ